MIIYDKPRSNEQAEDGRGTDLQTKTIVIIWFQVFFTSQKSFPTTLYLATSPNSIFASINRQTCGVFSIDLERAGWDVECNASLDRAPANETPMLLNAPAEGQLLELVGAYWSGER